MSSPCQCSPPFHPDLGDTRAQATSFYLVSSLAALDNCGIYTSWCVTFFFHLGPTLKETQKRSSAQRICENFPRGGATRFSWEACLPVWHACCDAGEHGYPSSPTIPACLEPPRTPKTLAHCTTACTPCTPTTATSASPSTVSMLIATGATFSVHRFAHTNPCRAPPSFPPLEVLRYGPRTLPPALDPPLDAPQTYVIRGSGTIHTSLDDALADFNIAVAQG
ncbi:hypothetical protein K438DRAFT_1764282 [Mycena galopus ATCC 62051]|nr:hypothetical protein K438DRAFT_1764282 [Mycena galopus ATCC 62051]